MTEGVKNLHEHPAVGVVPTEPRSISIAILVEDRRRHARYALRLAITMRGENNFYTGLSEDISEGGVFIATLHMLPIGTPVVLSFTLPGSDESLSVLGSVQWVRGPDATAPAANVFGGGREIPGIMPGIGVRFRGIDAETRQTIRDFMQRRRPVFFDA